ncbi:S-adenosyl-L-methionine-dependent methyltransferase [Amanita rubescens]|nr:S-adenosyl-L-methionine-dependent methyltransferase [Amanita rubescens]
MFQQVRQLLDLITKSVDTLEQVCTESKMEISSLDEPFKPIHIAFWVNPVVAEAAAIITAATSHLGAIVSPPQATLDQVSGGGLHVDHIAGKNGLDAQKLGHVSQARCLRMMATHHIYREVKPDVFTNNRVSSLLDTLKPSAEIIADPFHKYDDTFGPPASLGHELDDVFKASACLWETASDPKMAKSGEPNGSCFLADLTLLMSAVASELQLCLAKEFFHLKFVIQDRPAVVDAGVEIWKKELPGALSSGRVQFQVHDFFDSQPQTDASIFFVKNVLHDWSDKYSSKILKRLRDAATSNTKLVVLETILPYACHETEDSGDGISSAVPVKAPIPLLANWGAVNDLAYGIDISGLIRIWIRQMLALLNGQERTIRQFDQLFKGAGWKITALCWQRGVNVALLSSVEAVPI